MVASSSVIGAAVPRAEGPDKVTGRALYAADVQLPGMLWGKVLRSPYPHARIKSIDASRARAAPGARAVVTGGDHPGLLMGKQMRDMPVLCWDKVRFIGDRVAAVAAGTKEEAEDALHLIEVEYEELPAVFDPLEAMRPEAPRVHDDVTAYEGSQPRLLIPDVPNGLTRVTYGKGEIELGFREADLILEHTFSVPSRHTGYIEPHAGVVAIEGGGRVQVWMSTKSPFRTRDSLAKTVDIPEARIRVNPVNVGGDFGGKGDAMDLPIAYLLAQQAGRPVSIVMTYVEELMAGNPSHPSIITIRTGVKRDGRMVARYVRAVHASGAYGAFKPTPQVAIGGVSHGGGPYRIDHTFFEAIQVYTNHVPCGFFRAPGASQIVFAAESHTDLIAQELGMDPAEFRMRNLVGEGEENAVGNRLQGVRAREVLQVALEASGWQRPMPGPHYGRGIGMYERGVPGGPTGAVLLAMPDGGLRVLSPTFDQGVGTHTILRQIVAQEMQLPLGLVEVVIGDTDTVPYDGGVGGSRVTNTAGQAAVKACDQLRDELASRAAGLLECPDDMVAYDEGRFWVREDLRRSLGIGEIVTRTGAGGPVSVTATVNVDPRPDLSCFCAQVAEVEVDPETGQVRLHRFVTAHDVGTVINPVTHQGQIDGGVVQGIGLALMEELAMEEGQVTALHLGEYKLPTIADVPELETALLSTAEGPLPYGGKAIGEMANCSPAAAIANAVASAAGVRSFTLPITAERVYRALKDKSGG